MIIGQLPVADPRDVLSRPFMAGRLRGPNRFCAHPMEGCDADKVGCPTELTTRRYVRLAAGGSGLIWMEACCVDPAGRGNPQQLMIGQNTALSLKQLVEETREHATDASGAAQEPAIVLQLTHSGRYSKPFGKPKPLVVVPSRVSSESPGTVIQDAELDHLRDMYIAAAMIARDCGFDGVDIKVCHGYLLHELLTARSRKHSRYGGSFEQRTRLLLDIVAAIRDESPNLAITIRLNVFDGIPLPEGWGTDGEGQPDLTEPASLLQALKRAGVDLVSLAFGNPYVNPYLERQFDRPIRGGAPAPELPLESIFRIISLTKHIHDLVPDVPLVATGLSWLRHLGPYVGAGMVAAKWVELAGFGRLSVANPSFANRILQDGRIANNQYCITCSACVELMRGGCHSGCVVHDRAIYAEEYRKMLSGVCVSSASDGERKGQEES